MSVIENKLVPVDYDGNGTTDLGFLLPINYPAPPLVPSQGELGAWLFATTTGLPTVQATVGEPFIYANGDHSILGDGFIPGFGGAINDFFSGPAPLFPDFNGDGKTDQIFGDLVYDGSTFTGFELSTWLMNGVGFTLQAKIVDSTGNTAFVPEAWADPFLYSIGGQGPLGDFDGNSTSDILLLREVESGTEVGIWLMQGNVAFEQKIIGFADPGWSLINTNDFEGNGTTDLLFLKEVGEGNSELGIWTLDGTQATSQINLGLVGVDWSVVDTNDFNGDGKADVLFSKDEEGTTKFGVWTLDGTVITGQNEIGSTSNDWGLVDHNDLNGDGKADLLFSREVDGGTEYGFWLLNGTNSPISQGSLGVASDGFEFTNTGDFNGDKIADVSFYNDTTKEIAIWYLGSNGFATSQLVVGNFDSTVAPVGWEPPFTQPIFDIPPLSPVA
jgi:hypothetical protein